MGVFADRAKEDFKPDKEFLLLGKSFFETALTNKSSISRII